MQTIDIISRESRKLPESYQREVLDFVEFLLKKTKNGDSRKEDTEWRDFSLAGALRGMEDDDFPDYTEADFKEKWK
jgi:hypothetical protein